MRDYNFFQPLIERGGRRPGDDSFPYVPVIILLLILLAAWPGYNYYRLSQLKQEVNDLSTAVLDHPGYALLAEVSSQRGVVADAQNRLGTLKAMDSAFDAMEWLDEDLLYLVLASAPRDLSIESVSLGEPGMIQISGAATNRPAIAELEYNYRWTERFEDLHISVISREEARPADNFRFSLSMRVKGVSTNAAN